MNPLAGHAELVGKLRHCEHLRLLPVSITFVNMRHDAKTDQNQAEILKALRAVGVSVEYIKLPLDLLICIRGKTALMEVKMPGEHLNKNQAAFVASWPGQVFVVRSPEQAVNEVIEWGKP